MNVYIFIYLENKKGFNFLKLFEKETISYLVRWVYWATHLMTTTLQAIIGSIFFVPSPVSTKAEKKLIVTHFFTCQSKCKN